jgi:signal transduction histidine kinase/CheY-like chemotaxis protein
LAISNGAGLEGGAHHRAYADLLEGLDIACCVFDADDRALVWNESFLRFFPEHRGAIHVGEPYEDNLRRFYAGRLAGQELQFLERYVSDGVARHHAQLRPFAFEHLKRRIQVNALDVGGGARARIWREIPGAPGGQTSGSRASAMVPAIDLAGDVLEWFPEAVMLIGIDDKVTFVNRRLVGLYLLDDPAEIVGRSFNGFLDLLARRVPAEPGADEFGPEWRWRMVEHRRFPGVPYEFQLPGGRWVRIVESRTADGGFCALHTEITEIKRQETALANARRAAEAASQAKSQFLATMSHELRTPMNGVIGMIDLLNADTLSADQARWLGPLKQSAEAMMQLLGDILDLSKIEAGSLVLERADFQPRAVAEDVIRLFAVAAAAKGLRLEFDWPPDATRDRLIGDPVRLRQVLVNLLGNAVKFTGRGMVALRLDSSEATRDGKLRLLLSVSDTGPGIAPEHFERLFKPFSQADSSTSRRFGGSGLGLVISRRLVEAMGGAIGVESTAGLGARFWFDVVFELGATAASSNESEPQPAGTGAGLRLLVAEDNAINRLVVGAFLAHAGHHVTFVENGSLAVAAAHTGGWDAILMDMRMPEMDGATATRAIRALPAPFNAVPIIGVTADALSNERSEHMKAGLDAYVTKPIKQTDLERVLAAVTQRPLPISPRASIKDSA